MIGIEVVGDTRPPIEPREYFLITDDGDGLRAQLFELLDEIDDDVVPLFEVTVRTSKPQPPDGHYRMQMHPDELAMIYQLLHPIIPAPMEKLASYQKKHETDRMAAELELTNEAETVDL